MEGNTSIQNSLWPLWKEAYIEKEETHGNSCDFEQVLMLPQTHSHCMVRRLAAERR